MLKLEIQAHAKVRRYPSENCDCEYCNEQDVPLVVHLTDQGLVVDGENGSYRLADFEAVIATIKAKLHYKE